MIANDSVKQGTWLMDWEFTGQRLSSTSVANIHMIALLCYTHTHELTCSYLEARGNCKTNIEQGL